MLKLRTFVPIFVFAVIMAMLVTSCGSAVPSTPPVVTKASPTPTETVTNPAYPEVDTIFCDTQTPVYHVHAHLTLYINGSNLPLPANMGLATDGSCAYWMHTHDTTGVIHIESPSQRIFTLGNFFDEWAKVFPALGYPPELDLSASNWVAYVNGKLYKGDFHTIPMDAHALITLAYNTPNVKPDTTYYWGGL
jgi:hypothetical protein